MLDISCQSHLLKFESKWRAIARINTKFFVFERIKCNLAKNQCWLVVVQVVEEVEVVVVVVEVEILFLGFKLLGKFYKIKLFFLNLVAQMVFIATRFLFFHLFALQQIADRQGELLFTKYGNWKYL